MIRIKIDSLYPDLGYLYLDAKLPIAKTVSSKDELFNFDVNTNNELVGVEFLHITKINEKYQITVSEDNLSTIVELVNNIYNQENQ